MFLCDLLPKPKLCCHPVLPGRGKRGRSAATGASTLRHVSFPHLLATLLYLTFFLHLLTLVVNEWIILLGGDG